MEKKVFRSRISLLIFVFILTIFISASIPIVQEKVYALGGILLFIILLFTRIRYVILGDKLLVKVWFIPFGSANIAEITSIERSYNPISSPAASLKRLQISFVKNRYWLISPVKEQKFIEELRAVNPTILINVPNKKKNIWRMQDWDI